MLAYIPGLIEGAHEGVGIGDRFLGHVERNRVLLHLVSGQEEDVAKAYRTVVNVLDAYGHGLTDKPEILALSQIDTLDEDERAEKLKELAAASGKTPMMLSAATGEGMQAALRALRTIILESKGSEPSDGSDDFQDDAEWAADADRR